MTMAVGEASGVGGRATTRRLRWQRLHAGDGGAVARAAGTWWLGHWLVGDSGDCEVVKVIGEVGD